MRVEYRAEDAPLGSRMDYWRHVMDDTVGSLELQVPDTADFRDRLVTGALGAVNVAELSISHPGQADRTARHVRSSEPELCKIDVQIHGRAAIEHGGRQAVLDPGDFTFVDLSRPCRWIAGPARLTAVAFPRALLPLRSDDLARLAGVRFAGSQGVGALVSSLARQLPAHLDDRDGADGSRLGTAVLDLLTGALAARLDRHEQVPPATRQRALLLRVRAFIEQHLSDDQLSPASIAAANHISVRYLHKLFEGEQATVADWIRRRRLERSRRDLLDPALRALPVAAIGARWGLTHPAHFSRLFRAAYGAPPTRYRAVATAREA